MRKKFKEPVYVPLKEVPEEMRKRIRAAIRRTWDTIAYDSFQCRKDCGEKGDMPRSEVIEVTLDADYPSMHGGDKEATDVLKTLSYPDAVTLAKQVFTCLRYGM